MYQLRAMLLVLAAALVVLLAVSYSYKSRQDLTGPTATGPRTTGQQKQLTPDQKLAATRRLIDSRLREIPEYAHFFKLFEENFPAAHKRIFDGFADTASKTGHIESADLYLAQARRGLRSSHGVLAAGASQQALENVFAMQADILKKLSVSNPKLCADFLYGAASQPFFEFSEKNRSLIAAMAEAGLKAIIDGKGSNVQRAAPTDKEFAALEAALRKEGLEKPEIEMLLDAKMPDPPLADVTICKAGQTYYETLRTIPEATRIKIYALAIKLLARS